MLSTQFSGAALLVWWIWPCCLNRGGGSCTSPWLLALVRKGRFLQECFGCQNFLSLGAVDDTICSCWDGPAWQPEISFSLCCRRGGLDHVHGQKPPRQKVRKRHPERWSFAPARLLLLCRSWWHHEETPWDPDLYRSNQGTTYCLRRRKRIVCLCGFSRDLGQDFASLMSSLITSCFVPRVGFSLTRLKNWFPQGP